MTEEKVLEAIKECGYISEMDNTPEVAFHKTEDGDTRFLVDGSFVIYDIKTNLKAENIKKVAAKDPYRGGPYILFKLNDGNELMLNSQPDSHFCEADIESFKDELINKYGGVPLLHEGNMGEAEILEQIEDCSCMTEMDYMPNVAFSQYEDGDTYFDEDGHFVIYNVTTCLCAEDFLAIRWKDNDELTRDPYVAFYLSGNRYLILNSIPGNMREADVERFKKKLIEEYSVETVTCDSFTDHNQCRRENLWH